LAIPANPLGIGGKLGSSLWQMEKKTWRKDLPGGNNLPHAKFKEELRKIKGYWWRT